MSEALGNEAHLGLETGGREPKFLLKPRDRHLPPENKTLFPLHSQSPCPCSEHIRLLELQLCYWGAPESGRPYGNLALVLLSLHITDLARAVSTEVNPPGLAHACNEVPVSLCETWQPSSPLKRIE